MGVKLYPCSKCGERFPKDDLDDNKVCPVCNGKGLEVEESGNEPELEGEES